MKHSEINSNQNNFGIQLSSLEINKSFSLTEQGIAVSNPNPNTLMLSSVLPTHINTNQSTILNSMTNPRSINIPEVKNYNLAIFAKPNSSSSTTINSNSVNPLSFHPNNTIKLVNLSKCQQISNINKDNSNTIQNNTINVQFVSNTSNTACAESSVSQQSNCKIDTITLNSMTTSTTNQSMSTTSSSLTGTRFVIQGAPSQFLHQGTLTFIPHTPDVGNNSQGNNHLIKNPKYVFTGNKSHHQTIRPITTGSTSSIVSQSNMNKQPISIISPSKAIGNFGSISTLNMTDVAANQTGIQDLTINRAQSVQSDSQRISKNAPVKIPLHSYSVSTNSNNNIRLALTSTINNSRVNNNQSKIQLISPKSRKRSGSPTNLMHDGKIRNQIIGSKDENVDNSLNYNSQLGNYSPTRKRARKQHLKSVNTKSQKPVINQKILLNNKIEPANHLNNIRPALNDKMMPTTVVVPSNASKVSNVTFQNKLDENMSTQTPGPINTQIFIGIKNPIQFTTSKASMTNSSLQQRPTSLYPNNLCNNTNGPNVNINSNNGHITPNSQFQIISQNQNIKQIQLSPNFILSPKIKCQTPFSPSKVIHIAPSISNISRTSTPIKNEIVSTEPVVTVAIDEKPISTEKKETLVEPVKVENSDIKSEASDDSNVKISLFPVKYNWNARRNHFIKKSDVKFKKAKTTPVTKFNSNVSNSENPDEIRHNNDVEINDTSWFVYKAFCQILTQKTYDEENLQKMYKLKERFDVSPQIDDFSKPIFRKICAKTQFSTPIPDQIIDDCLSKYTDPHLFGISEDIIDNYVNSITTNDAELTFPNDLPHECTSACIFYSLEVPPTAKPQKFGKIIDLIEGLIVKERNIIEKESEINNQFLKILRHTTDYTSQNKTSPNKANNHCDRIKLFGDCRR